jgi:hypothetical protein
MNFFRLLRPLALLGALIAPALSATAQQVTLIPQSLDSREKVTINVTTAARFALGRESVSMVNNAITVVMRSYDEPTGPGPFPPAIYTPATNGDVVLGRLPQGAYTVEVQFRNLLTDSSVFVGSLQFVVKDDFFARSTAYPAYDFSDIWWNATESGWGISIHAKNDKLFAAWFVYDAAGKPVWYTLQQGRWQSSTLHSGVVYVTQSNPNAGIGPLSTVSITPVGTGTITFIGTDRADFRYEVNGVQNQKAIVRQVF